MQEYLIRFGTQTRILSLDASVHRYPSTSINCEDVVCDAWSRLDRACVEQFSVRVILVIDSKFRFEIVAGVKYARGGNVVKLIGMKLESRG